MKKVLILAYDFPPYVSVGGLRPYSWYKYFHEFGVYPIVVTRQWGNEYGNHLDYIAPSESSDTVIEETEFGTIIRTPYKPNLANRIMLKYWDSKFSFIRKAITAYYEFAQFLFFVGTKSELYFGAKKYLKENRVDCIIATGTPHILFKYAAKLSKSYKTPWIADYRDPWSQSTSRSSNIFLKKWNKYYEKLFVKSASEIITVSDLFKCKISSLFKDKRISIISNGYDPEALLDINQSKTHNELSIAFVGTIYFYHPIVSFLKAINNFLMKDIEKTLRINFFGVNNEDEINKIIIENRLHLVQSVIKFYPKMSNSDVLKEISKNSLMLLFNNYLKIGTKIYDYLAIKRPILFCYSEEKVNNINEYPYYSSNSDIDNPQIKLIKETDSGFIVKNALELEVLLEELYISHMNNGYIECNSRNIEKYSRYYQTEKLSNIINEIIAK